MFYRVRLDPDDNGTVMASFPEVPGALSYGASPEDALARAQDALLTVFDALMRDRQALPPSSTPDGHLGITLPAREASRIAAYRALHEQR